MIKSEIQRFRYLILFIGAIGIIIAFQSYIQSRYITLIKTPHLIEDFKTTKEQDLPLLKEKYRIDYARVRSGKIIELPKIDLPHMDLLTVSLVTNSSILQNSVRDSLLLTRPYIFRSSYSLYILFPLVFPEKKDGFLIIKKILL